MRVLRMITVGGAALMLMGIGSQAQLSEQGPEDTAQTPSVVVVNAEPPATKLERFALTKDALIVRGSSDAGQVQGEDQSSVSVAAAQFVNAATGEKAFGLLVTIHSGRAGERQAVAYVDEDEIDALATGIDALAKLDRSGMTMPDFEGRYCTRGNLELLNSKADGARTAVVRSAQTLPLSGQRFTAVAHLPLSRLDEIRQRIITGKQALERAKAQ